MWPPGGGVEPQRGEQLSERIPRAREAGCSPRSVRLQEGGPRGRRAAPGPGGDGDAGIVTVTRNGVAAEGSMLGLFSERLPGRLRREPGLSWGDSANREREGWLGMGNGGHPVGWHHPLNGHEFEQTRGDGGGWRSPAVYSLWGCKASDRT